VQFAEYQDQEKLLKLSESASYLNWFMGLDCRYNHLCLDNHTILASKLMTALTRSRPADFTEGFLKDLVAEDWHQDHQFCTSQLDPIALDKWHREIKPNPPSTVWKIRTGINKILG
jgi:hypothetical protein